MTSAFPTTASAPPTTTNARIITNNSFNRISAMNANPPQTSSRFKQPYDNRRYTNVQTPYKRPSQPPANLNPNSRMAPPLSRVEIAPLPSARLVLQQQVSSPGRLQHQQQQSASTPQFVVPINSVVDPLVVGRSRPAPLPPPTVRNAIQRNAVSLNTLSSHHQNGAVIRGRSQNSSQKGSVSNRTTRTRQQSLAPFDLQQHSVTYAPTTVIYRHPLNTDSPPVFFE